MFRIMIHTVLFCLCLLLADGVFVDTDEMKSVSVMEGDSVTLNTDVTDIQRDDQILWMFKLISSDISIAEIYKQIISIYDSDDERFRDRLQLDSQTGSLTIRNIRITNSGLYRLQIRIKNEVTFKNFNVTVYAPLSIPVITRDSSQCSSSSERPLSSKCVLLCSVMNVTQVTLSWYKGNSLLSSISVSDLNTLSLPLEVEYQDNNTYSCVVNNTITNQTKHLNITDLCLPCSDSHLRVYLSVLSITLLVVVVVGLCYFMHNYRKTRQEAEAEEEIHYATTTFYSHHVQHTKVNGADQIVYSSVVS